MMKNYYRAIYADPPWQYFNVKTGGSMISGSAAKYPTMSLIDICNMGIPAIAHSGGSVLFLWATTPLLPEAFQVMSEWGFCVGTGTKILTRDLRWVPAETLNVGDKLIGFDDVPIVNYNQNGNHRRYFRESVVLSTGMEMTNVWEIELEDGRIITCTPEHKWLGIANNGEETITWIQTKDIPTKIRHKSRTHSVQLVDILPVQEPVEDYKHGYLAGALDGEGTIILRHRNRPGAPKLSLAQNENAMLSRIEQYLKDYNYEYSRYETYTNEKDVKHINIRGGWVDTMRLLMATQPPRLIDKWCKNEISFSMYNTKRVNVIDARPAGIKPIVTIQTSTGTYIAEGLGAHNTYKTSIYWRKIMSLGMGFWFRGQVEVCLLGIRGDVKAFRCQKPNFIQSKVRAHSQKPEELWQLIEPELDKYGLNPRIELFCRGESRKNWDGWGKECPNSVKLDL